jgi:SAM-dependent methyltransferase
MGILWGILAVLGILLLLKIVYVVSLVASLPRTGGALFCFTHPAKIRAVLQELPLGEERQVIDLGCGDGRFLAAAARRYGIHGTGYEINPVAWLLARFRLLPLRHRIRVRRRDFWKVSLAGADLVFCYLFPDLMPRLAAKARRELKPGAFLVSCNFELPGWKPERILTADHPSASDPIYVYRQPPA